MIRDAATRNLPDMILTCTKCGKKNVYNHVLLWRETFNSIFSHLKLRENEWEKHRFGVKYYEGYPGTYICSNHK